MSDDHDKEQPAAKRLDDSVLKLRKLVGRVDELGASHSRDITALQHQIVEVFGKIDDHMRETRMVMRHLMLPEAHVWARWTARPKAPGKRIYTHSPICKQADFKTPWFAYWTHRIDDVLRFHRKLWEFVFVCQVLHERGLIAPGRRGLGFGVGEEALPALFAAEGCEIVASDLGVEEASAIGWVATKEHARDKQALQRPNICPEALFDQRVSFRNVDMNAIPEDLRDFDFCWSACAFEHLGSIELGLRFVEESLKTLRPGGVAVHTTEFNLSSNDETVSTGGTVLFRQRDIEELVRRLEAEGHEVAPLDLNPGRGEVDRYIDLPPYCPEPHLKLALWGYACTSFGLIVRKKQ